MKTLNFAIFSQKALFIMGLAHYVHRLSQG